LSLAVVCAAAAKNWMYLVPQGYQYIPFVKNKLVSILDSLSKPNYPNTVMQETARWSQLHVSSK
jgi:hypothetical protein